ncbi:MAG: stage IV sporulation protein A [Eubacteriales bacterium]
MTNTSIYQDIAKRTGGDIYIGVVGPVRTGKSTFLKKFMENLVLPNMEAGYDRERAKDEMPQSAAGKTVMTTEPKFIPDEAVPILIDGVAKLSVKMVDCVGYLVDGALGASENGEPRMVMTPWSGDPMPFEEAAETGTRKVITDHATIGILVTTDGSITEIDRTAYEDAERRVAAEMSALGKPFAVVLNSAHPEYPETQALAMELESRYRAPVALVNCLELNGEDIRHILELVLLEFPICSVEVKLPEWTDALPDDYPLMVSLQENLLSAIGSIKKVGEVAESLKNFKDESAEGAVAEGIDLGSGNAVVEIRFCPEVYYQVLSDLSGLTVSGQSELISTLCKLSEIKSKYDRVATALSEVEEKGYGVVIPEKSDLILEEPKIVKHSGGYGVLLKASAPSIHMIRATIQTEISPVVGTEAQSEDLVNYLLEEFQGEDSEKIWSTNLFGRTLYELVNDGLAAKLANLPDDARMKMAETLSRIINEGSGGLICIIL